MDICSFECWNVLKLSLQEVLLENETFALYELYEIL